MVLKDWEALPEKLQNEQVRFYHDSLSRKRISLRMKRLFDVTVAAVAGIILLPVMVLVGVAVKLDSPGPVFFRQERVTAYGKVFRIWKFRSMVANAEQQGAQVTSQGDSRITRVGKVIRKCRLDEIPQLFNILAGDMTFVGVRPEVQKYVDHYTEEMYATLLLPAGVTSEASIRYKNEDAYLTEQQDPDQVYIQNVMPGKMYYNLKAMKQFSLLEDLKTLLRTVLAVCGKEYADEREAVTNGTNNKA